MSWGLGRDALGALVVGSGFGGSGGWFSLCCLLQGTEQLEGGEMVSIGVDWGLGDGMTLTYYGSEQRGHLYLAGCVPHTPQSLGSGFVRGGADGSGSGP